jgi:hypothetical protein
MEQMQCIHLHTCKYHQFLMQVSTILQLLLLSHHACWPCRKRLFKLYTTSLLWPKPTQSTRHG